MNNLSVFSEEIKDTFLIHIPHSSLVIPNPNDFLLNPVELQKENLKSADIGIDEIFNLKGIDSVIFPFSRLFCDVEKLPIREIMDLIGRGIYYTKTLDELNLREFSFSDYWNILTNHYFPHHNKMINQVKQKLVEFDVVRILDVHSFNGFNEQDPDICIGIDEFHTPTYLIEHIENHFKFFGFSTKKNHPYSGTYVPLPYYQTNKKVESIMIEINKRLYCDKNYKPIQREIERLNNIVKTIFEF